MQDYVLFLQQYLFKDPFTRKFVSNYSNRIKIRILKPEILKSKFSWYLFLRQVNFNIILTESCIMIKYRHDNM